MDIYNYTSRERSIEIDTHTHSIHVQCIHVMYTMCVKGGVGPLCMNAHLQACMLVYAKSDVLISSVTCMY